MHIADFINGCFEFGGAWFCLQNCIRVQRDKMVRGVYWPAIAFFATWGWWNTYFYPSLDQWFSFAGGLALVIFNTAYALMLVYYIQRENSVEGFMTRVGDRLIKMGWKRT